MSWICKRGAWGELARKIDPSIRLYTKDHWIWGLYGKKARTSTASVWGPLHFYPREWDDIDHELHHEGRHTRQQRWFGLGLHPWVGFLLWSIVSVFLLPVGLTVRFWLELDAETFALQRKVATGSSAQWAQHELKEFAGLLCGPDYVWAWPKGWGLRIAEKRGRQVFRVS